MKRISAPRCGFVGLIQSLARLAVLSSCYEFISATRSYDTVTIPVARVTFFLPFRSLRLLLGRRSFGSYGSVEG